MRAGFASQARNLLFGLSELLGGDGLRKYLARGLVGIITIRVVAQSTYFATNLILARSLDLSHYGTVEYVLSWIALLSTFSILGMERLLVREIAVYQTRAAWTLLKGLVLWASKIAFTVACLLVLVVILILAFKSQTMERELLISLLVGAALIPLSALTRVRAAILRGLRKVILGQAAEALLQPVIFLCLIIVAGPILQRALSASLVLGLHVAAALAVLIAGQALLWRRMPSEVHSVSADYRSKAWFYSVIPLVVFNGLLAVNKRLDVLMLGNIRGTEAVGVFSVAASWAALVPYILASMNIVWSPIIAHLHEVNDPGRIQRMVTMGTRGITALSSLVSVLMLINGRWLLSLYGSQFETGELALRIMIIGQILAVALGPGAHLLIMTGNDKLAALSSAFSLALTVVLSLLLVPRWGLEGSAVASAASTVLFSFLTALWCYRSLGIDSTFAGRNGHRSL